VPVVQHGALRRHEDQRWAVARSEPTADPVGGRQVDQAVWEAEGAMAGLGLGWAEDGAPVRRPSGLLDDGEQSGGQVDPPGARGGALAPAQAEDGSSQTVAA
jgi:hypothetical protein